MTGGGSWRDETVTDARTSANQDGAKTTRAAPSSLIGKTAWTSIATVSGAAASAASIIAVARILGAEGAGTVAYGVWVASVAAQISLLALPQVALRFLAADSESSGVAPWLVRRSAVLMPFGVLGAVGAGIASREPPAVVAATAALTLVAMAGAMGQALLAGTQQTRRLARVSVVAAVVQVAATAGGCVVAGPVGGIVGHLAGTLPLLLGLDVASGRRAPPPAVVRRIRSYAAHSWIASTAALVAWSRLEFIFLQAKGASAVALYSVAVAMSQMALQPAALLGTGLVPHFGELVSGEHTETSRETFAAVTRVAAFLSLPLCFGIAAVSPGLVPLMFGPSFSDAVAPSMVLLIAGSLVALAPAATAVAYAFERTRYISSVTIASALVAAAGFWLVIPRFGTIGAASVRATIHAGAVVVAFWYVRRLGAELPLARVSRAAVAAAIAGLAGRAVVGMLGARWPAVFAAVATVAAVYGLIVMRLRVLEPSDVLHLDGFAARVPGICGRAVRGYLRLLA